MSGNFLQAPGYQQFFLTLHDCYAKQITYEGDILSLTQSISSRDPQPDIGLRVIFIVRS